jgi:DNA recombination protein RmuC
MHTVEIILGAVVFLGIVIFAMYFLIQRSLLTLTKTNSEQRKSNQEEIETGVKGILNENHKLLAEITKGLEKQLLENRKDVGDLKSQNSAIREQLSSTAKATEGLQLSTDALKNLLANNRLRGEWGEQVAEDLLMAAGFVEKVNYTKQTSTAHGRPDFTILLPDGFKLNVDAKFPFDDLMAYQEAKTDNEKRRSLANFKAAIKQKVKEVSTKDYIDPENQTLDFVVMFIPNEMIFSFVYEKVADMNQYASERKVVMAGPFGFTALLRLVLQAHKNFRHEKGLAQILGLIEKFQEEYEKFGDSVVKLGKQIDTVKDTYLEVEGTRNRQLTRIVKQISTHSQTELPEKSQTKLIDSVKD